MNTLKQDYLRLVSLASLHLLQEYAEGDWLESNAETLDFFRHRLPARAAQPVSRPAPKVETPRPPPPAPLPAREVKTETPLPKPVATEPAPKTAAPQAPPTPSVSFALNPPAPRPRDEMTDWKNTLASVAPQLALLDKPPSPTAALLKQLQEAKVWVVTSKAMPPTHQAMLKDIAQAISLNFMQACVAPVEILSTIKEAPLIILSTQKSALSTLPGREGSEGAAALATVKHLDLPNLDLLMEDPDQKATLWRHLCEHVRIGDPRGSHS